MLLHAKFQQVLFLHVKHICSVSIVLCYVVKHVMFIFVQRIAYSLSILLQLLTERHDQCHACAGALLSKESGEMAPKNPQSLFPSQPAYEISGQALHLDVKGSAEQVESRDQLAESSERLSEFSEQPAESVTYPSTDPSAGRSRKRALAQVFEAPAGVSDVSSTSVQLNSIEERSKRPKITAVFTATPEEDSSLASIQPATRQSEPFIEESTPLATRQSELNIEESTPLATRQSELNIEESTPLATRQSEPNVQESATVATTQAEPILESAPLATTQAVAESARLPDALASAASSNPQTRMMPRAGCGACSRHSAALCEVFLYFVVSRQKPFFLLLVRKIAFSTHDMLPVNHLHHS